MNSCNNALIDYVTADIIIQNDINTGIIKVLTQQ